MNSLIRQIALSLCILGTPLGVTAFAHAAHAEPTAARDLTNQQALEAYAALADQVRDEVATLVALRYGADAERRHPFEMEVDSILTHMVSAFNSILEAPHDDPVFGRAYLARQEIMQLDNRMSSRLHLLIRAPLPPGTDIEDFVAHCRTLAACREQLRREAVAPR